MAQSNLTALKREVNKAIEDGNFDRADELSKQLCEMQGFEDAQAIESNATISGKAGNHAASCEVACFFCVMNS